MPLGDTELRKYIPYSFFNRSSHARFSFTCFPNDNITLGIVRGKEVYRDNGLNSYKEKMAVAVAVLVTWVAVRVTVTGGAHVATIKGFDVQA